MLSYLLAFRYLKNHMEARNILIDYTMAMWNIMKCIFLDSTGVKGRGGITFLILLKTYRLGLDE